jgi:hypothetical protein
MRKPRKGYEAVYLEIGVHNPTTRMISSETFDLALVVPPNVRVDDARSAVTQLDGSRVCNLRRLPSIFPDGWENIGLDIHCESTEEPIKLTLRLFKEMGKEDFPFMLVLNSPKRGPKGGAVTPNPADRADV